MISKQNTCSLNGIFSLCGNCFIVYSISTFLSLAWIIINHNFVHSFTHPLILSPRTSFTLVKHYIFRRKTAIGPVRWLQQARCNMRFLTSYFCVMLIIYLHVCQANRKPSSRLFLRPWLTVTLSCIDRTTGRKFDRLAGNVQSVNIAAEGGKMVLNGNSFVRITVIFCGEFRFILIFMKMQ